jgi:HAE1 family hydrophobic/amphiphilic exporter-1/multidrug efflux pump
MLIATLVGVFFIPVFYVLLQRMSERQWPFRPAEAATPPAAGSAAVVAGKGEGGGTPASPARGD